MKQNLFTVGKIRGVNYDFMTVYNSYTCIHYNIYYVVLLVYCYIIKCILYQWRHILLVMSGKKFCRRNFAKSEKWYSGKK